MDQLRGIEQSQGVKVGVCRREFLFAPFAEEREEFLLRNLKDRVDGLGGG